MHVSLDGVDQQVGLDFSVDFATGLLTFVQPPASGVEIKSGFEFDVPVRFDTDVIQTSLATFEAGEAPDVPLVEVRS